MEEFLNEQEQAHFYYAVLENGICTGISDLSGAVDSPDMVLLASYDMSVMGKRYNNGVWEDVPPAPAPPAEPTIADLQAMVEEVQEQNLILMEVLAEMYEQQNPETI